MNSQGETPREETRQEAPAPIVAMPTSSFVRWFGPVRIESKRTFRWYGPVRVAQDPTEIKVG